MPISCGNFSFLARLRCVWLAYLIAGFIIASAPFAILPLCIKYYSTRLTLTATTPKRLKSTRELLALLQAKNTRPNVRDVYKALADEGVEVPPTMAKDVARIAREAEAKNIQKLVKDLCETLPRNPKKREIEVACARAGYPIDTPNDYRIIRDRLAKIPSLWIGTDDSVRFHLTLTASESRVVNRIAGMCGIGENEVFVFALKALVIAADNGSVSLPEIFSAANKFTPTELDSASQIFERLSLKGIK